MERRSRAREGVDVDEAAGFRGDAPHHPGAVQPIERDLVEGGPVGDEVAGRIDVRAEVADHLHLGHVQRIARHAHDPGEARFREERDAGEIGTQRVRKLDPRLVVASSARRGARRERTPPLPGHAHASSPRVVPAARSSQRTTSV
jgi:hypothetical protein